MYYEIKTKRLLLRPLCTNDFETTHIYTTNKDLTRYMMFLPHTTEEETKSFLKNATANWQQNDPCQYEFAIILHGKHIGGISIEILDKAHQKGMLSWILHPDYHGQGYMTEAASALVDFSQRKIGLNEWIACCDARNAASANVMKKIGMHLVNATGSRTYPKTGEIAPELVYAITLSTEYTNSK